MLSQLALKNGNVQFFSNSCDPRKWFKVTETGEDK